MHGVDSVSFCLNCDLCDFSDLCDWLKKYMLCVYGLGGAGAGKYYYYHSRG